MLGQHQGANVLIPESSKGNTLIEMMIAIVILCILLVLTVRSYGVWIANSRIRTAAETLAAGLSAARNEAIKRNRSVGFYLVTDLSSDCGVSGSGTSWVASIDDPAKKCDAAVAAALAPFIVAKKSAAEGTDKVTISALDASGAAASSIIFNGVGRVLLAGPSPIAKIDIASSALASDQAREMRIVLTTGGMIRMCDPSISDTTDTRIC
jgi:type IV fimbrial biogenesis protein FimT